MDMCSVEQLRAKLRVVTVISFCFFTTSSRALAQSFGEQHYLVHKLWSVDPCLRLSVLENSPFDVPPIEVVASHEAAAHLQIGIHVKSAGFCLGKHVSYDLKNVKFRARLVNEEQSEEIASEVVREKEDPKCVIEDDESCGGWTYIVKLDLDGVQFGGRVYVMIDTPDGASFAELVGEKYVYW